MAKFRRNFRAREERQVFDIAAWQPKTQLGKDVKERRVTSIEEIFKMGKPIQEAAIIDALLPNLKSEVIEISSVQRMTKNNRKQKFRAVAIVGDGNGHVGVGSGKDVEVKSAITSATFDAKRNVMPVRLGCGSWQCLCGTKHSIPLTVRGRCGSVEVILKPAPRGMGIVASEPIRKMLTLAGVKDVWSFSKGRTEVRYNAMLAVQSALSSMYKMKNIVERETVAEKEPAHTDEKAGVEEKAVE